MKDKEISISDAYIKFQRNYSTLKNHGNQLENRGF